MPDITTPHRYKVDLNLGPREVALHHALYHEDANADSFTAIVERDGQPIDLSGVTVVGSFRYFGDNTIIPLKGSISGNEASVTFLPECYARPGEFSMTLQLRVDGVDHTVLRIKSSIVRTNTNKLASCGNIAGLFELLELMSDLKSSAGSLLYVNGDGYVKPLSLGAGLQIVDGVLYVNGAGSGDSGNDDEVVVAFSVDSDGNAVLTGASLAVGENGSGTLTGASLTVDNSGNAVFA